MTYVLEKKFRQFTFVIERCVCFIYFFFFYFFFFFTSDVFFFFFFFVFYFIIIFFADPFFFIAESDFKVRVLTLRSIYSVSIYILVKQCINNNNNNNTT